MDDVTRFAGLVPLVSVAGVVALQSNRLSARLKYRHRCSSSLARRSPRSCSPPCTPCPTRPCNGWSRLRWYSSPFDGGLGIGWRRLRPAVVPVVVVGVLGTFLTDSPRSTVRPRTTKATISPRPAREEKVFILWAGLKGAVPIQLGTFLLGTFLFDPAVPDGARLYGIVIVVMVASVLVQGSTVPTVARRRRVG